MARAGGRRQNQRARGAAGGRRVRRARCGRRSSRSPASSAQPGRLMAEEQADVAAETAGRVVATPVERGTRGRAGRRAGSPVGDRNRSAGQRSRSQRRADRGAARADRRSGVRRQCGARSAEREGDLRAGAERIRAHPVAARAARRLAVGVRPAPHAGGGGPPAVRGGKNRAAQQYQALQAARARVDAGAQGARRHRRPRAVQRPRRRAARLGRRLRDQGDEGGGGRPGRSAARRS